MKSLSFFTPERRWVFIFAFVVMVITTVPYIVGFAIQDEEWRFTGFIFGVEDGNSYVANMLSGRYGAWLFKTPYTGYPQRGVVAFLPYILLGKLPSPLNSHDQLIFIYHLYRIIAGILAIFAMYSFLDNILSDVTLSRFGAILVTLGGGLGWLQIFFGNNSLPLEFYSPEAFGFLSLYGIPHLALARAALFWGLLMYLRAYDNNYETLYRDSMKIGTLWLIMALAQPLTAVVFGVVLFMHIIALIIGKASKKFMNIIGWHELKQTTYQTFLALIIPLPFLLYNFYSFTYDPFLVAWMNQNIITSPHPLNYFYAYLLVLPLATVGLYCLLRKHPWKGFLLTAWVITIPILMYIPVYMQRRIIEGLWVVLITLSMFAIKSVRNSNMERVKKSLFIQFFSKYPVILALVFPSTIILLIGGCSIVKNPSRPIYRPTAEIDAFQFFESNETAFDIVLASYETGNVLPAWAPVRTVIGHGPLTIDFENVYIQVSSVYNNDTKEDVRKDILSNLNVRYVFWGPEERKLGIWNPNHANYLTRVYERGGYSIFEFPLNFKTNE